MSNLNEENEEKMCKCDLKWDGTPSTLFYKCKAPKHECVCHIFYPEKCKASEHKCSCLNNKKSCKASEHCSCHILDEKCKSNVHNPDAHAMAIFLEDEKKPFLVEQKHDDILLAFMMDKWEDIFSRIRPFSSKYDKYVINIIYRLYDIGVNWATSSNDCGREMLAGYLNEDVPHINCLLFPDSYSIYKNRVRNNAQFN